MLQGWKARVAEQTPTLTKPAQPQASEPTKEAINKESICKGESQLGPDPTLEGIEGL